jgi:hypothetical protein
MPMNSHEDTTTFDSVVEDEQLKDLMKTLQFLKKNYDFNWNDLHSDNIMIRPGTGVYVISDPNKNKVFCQERGHPFQNRTIQQRERAGFFEQSERIAIDSPWHVGGKQKRG